MKQRKGARRRLLITAGPTREPIDPVRFISNHSTGTLGYVLAEAALKRGHQVTLISGPTGMPNPKGVRRVDVETAAQMQRAVKKNFPKADALIMSAAVADFRPIRMATHKIKRSGITGSLKLWQLELIENQDIVSEVARKRKPAQAVVGFALETENWLANARLKLKTKSLDAVVATRYSPRGKARGPFGTQPVAGAILDRDGRGKPFRALPKGRLAAKILETVEKLLQPKGARPLPTRRGRASVR